MKVEFRRSFIKDLKRVRDKALKKRVKRTVELVEGAENLQKVRNIKKLGVGDRYYSIRIGDYRLGLVVEGDTNVFVRFLHRQDIYRYFP